MFVEKAAIRCIYFCFISLPYACYTAKKEQKQEEDARKLVAVVVAAAESAGHPRALDGAQYKLEVEKKNVGDPSCQDICCDNDDQRPEQLDVNAIPTGYFPCHIPATTRVGDVLQVPVPPELQNPTGPTSVSFFVDFYADFWASDEKRAKDHAQNLKDEGQITKEQRNAFTVEDLPPILVYVPLPQQTDPSAPMQPPLDAAPDVLIAPPSGIQHAPIMQPVQPMPPMQSVQVIQTPVASAQYPPALAAPIQAENITLQLSVPAGATAAPGQIIYFHTADGQMIQVPVPPVNGQMSPVTVLAPNGVAQGGQVPVAVAPHADLTPLTKAPDHESWGVAVAVGPTVQRMGSSTKFNNPLCMPTTAQNISLPQGTLMKFTVEEVCQWVESFDIPSDPFRTNSIDGELLSVLDDDDLRTEFGGLTDMHIEKLRFEIQKIV